jgi:hypothetical protein
MPAGPRDEMDELLDTSLKFAQQLLDKRGEFYR